MKEQHKIDTPSKTRNKNWKEWLGWRNGSLGVRCARQEDHWAWLSARLTPGSVKDPGSKEKE